MVNLRINGETWTLSHVGRVTGDLRIVTISRHAGDRQDIIIRSTTTVPVEMLRTAVAVATARTKRR